VESLQQRLAQGDAATAAASAAAAKAAADLLTFQRAQAERNSELEAAIGRALRASELGPRERAELEAQAKAEQEAKQRAEEEQRTRDAEAEQQARDAEERQARYEERKQRDEVNQANVAIVGRLSIAALRQELAQYVFMRVES
jgi:hypothetical protein